MKNKVLLLTSFILLAGCHEKPKTSSESDQPTQKAAQQTQAVSEPVLIPATPESDYLANNSTPLPKGYSVDTTHLKKPLFIDFDGDGNLDTFRVLKNPNKKGMKYLFEFRISNSNKVYYYENTDKDYDLDIFGTFEVAPKTDIYVDEDYRFDEDGNILADEQIDPKHYLKFKGDGISVNVLEETCATSVFFLTDEKIKRIALC